MSYLSVEELELLDDPKYRNYISALDKALKNFEYTSEWADLISALGKLMKVLESNAKYTIIPRRVIIAKRLAQCLHPALPSGVHLKALETYSVIFKTIGPSGLAQELFLYSAGIYPLLAHAAINVRPYLLSLYETHIIPLAENLRPGLSGLITGLLPGLEEGSDHHEKINYLFEKVCQGVEPRVFYGCLWQCIADNPGVRLSASSFIVSHLNRKFSIEDQLDILGTNLESTIESLCASLHDSNVLVVRNFMDFIMAAFPLHSSHLMHSDLVRIVAAALSILLRRDMSLNRRLFSWLLGFETQTPDVVLSKRSEGSGPSEGGNSSYFQLHSKKLLVEAVQKLLEASCHDHGSELKPYRILVSVLEKPEIGPYILDEILVDVFRALYKSCNKHSGMLNQQKDVVKAANLLFGTLEPYYLWSFANRLLRSSFGAVCSTTTLSKIGSGTPAFLETCNLIHFLLEFFATDGGGEMHSEYLPSLLQDISALVSQFHTSLSLSCAAAGIDLMLSVLHTLQPVASLNDDRSSKLSCETSRHDEDCRSEDTVFHSPPSSPLLMPSSRQQRQYIELTILEVQNLLRAVLVKHLSSHEGEEEIRRKGRIALAKEKNDLSSEERLEVLLNGCIEGTVNAAFLETKPQNPDRNDSISFPVASPTKDLQVVVRQCCSLLRELSAFPTYCAASSAHSSFCLGPLKPWHELPDWLQLLAIYSCLLPKVNFDLGLIATEALLDFSMLTLSMMPSSCWKLGDTVEPEQRQVSTADDLYAVVMLPVITPGHLVSLAVNSNIFQVMARRLWEGISSTSAEEQQKCVELLYQLHSLAPPPVRNVAEDVIAAELVSQSQDGNSTENKAVLRFTTLWHLGRDLEPLKWGHSRVRTFDRCLLLLLDSLDPASRCYQQRCVVESWLCQSLLRSDLNRILDPILLRLLHPSSARVSIKRVTVCQPQPTEENVVDEDRVLAISSVNGDVVYHVTPVKSKPRPLKSSAAVLTTDWAGEGLTASFVARELPFPWQLQQHSPDPSMALFVNPFQEDYSTPQEPVTSAAIVASVLDDLIDQVVSKAVAAAAAARSKPAPSGPDTVHPLFSYMLLYCQVADSQQTLYTLKTLQNLLLTQPRLMLLGLVSTGMLASRSPHTPVLQDLLARHKKSIEGRGFHGELSTEWLAHFRNSMYLEVVLMTLLYHLQSFYPSLETTALSRSEISGNREVQLCCIQILTLTLTELAILVKEGGKGFSFFLSDLLSRCRLQKLVLRSTLAMLHNLSAVVRKEAKQQSSSKTNLSLAEEIMLFNESPTDGTRYTEAALTYSLKLLQSIIILEHHLSKQNPSSDAESQPTNQKMAKNSEGEKYYKGLPVHSQPMFLTLIISALRKKSLRHLHSEFTKLMAASLPFLGRSLPSLLKTIIPQICLNLEGFAPTSFLRDAVLPPDYVINQLEALTALCHFTLLDGGPSSTPAVAGSAGLLGGLGTIGFNGSSASSGSSSFLNGQIFHNLVHAFTPGAEAPTVGFTEAANDPLTMARQSLLSNLPRIIACVVNLWLRYCAESTQSSTLSKQVKHHLLEFAGPVARHHGTNFIAAVGVVWREKQTGAIPQKTKLLPAFNEEQLALVDLVTSIKVLPPDTVVQLLRQVVKQPPVIQVQSNVKFSTMEVSLLHFFHAYLQRLSVQQLTECWPSFMTLLRELSSMSPPVLFAGLNLLYEAVQQVSPLQDKKDQRELQDVTGKLLESCAAVAGACLEQTTWLRRNLSVRKDLTVSAETEELVENQFSETSSHPTSTVTNNGGNGNNSNTGQNSLQALLVLAELLAPLQDMVYINEDKERVYPLLTTVLGNVIPYLKHRSCATLPSFRAASQLLASLSNYPTTRKVWRREIFDLLLDAAFFQMDLASLQHWRTVVDNLLSHDKDGFRELLNRVTVTPSSSLGIFSSRDQEAEQRAMLLKRLAFALFCCDGDQYQRHLPDIQEKLSESLRIPHSTPVIQTQVFLCFRVLLLRTSQHHITSLWPSLIAETVQVLAQLEHEVKRESEDFGSQLRRLSNLDSSWLTNSSNGLQGHAHPAWLQLYLATCKLLHLTVALPATRLPQFQMYRWAFIGDAATWDHNSNDALGERSKRAQLNAAFVPYVTRICRILKAKMESAGLPEPKLNSSLHSIKSISDLYALFAHLEMRKSLWGSAGNQQTESDVIKRIEASFYDDFLEPVPSN